MNAGTALSTLGTYTCTPTRPPDPEHTFIRLVLLGLDDVDDVRCVI